jgi:hypothetical protein
MPLHGYVKPQPHHHGMPLHGYVKPAVCMLKSWCCAGILTEVTYCNEPLMALQRRCAAISKNMQFHSQSHLAAAALTCRSDATPDLPAASEER